jgi:hypothetical protein
VAESSTISKFDTTKNTTLNESYGLRGWARV